MLYNPGKSGACSGFGNSLAKTLLQKGASRLHISSKNFDYPSPVPQSESSRTTIFQYSTYDMVNENNEVIQYILCLKTTLPLGQD